MRHLVRRFFGHLFASPLNPSEQEQVAEVLHPELLVLFYAQATQDQRHALDVTGRLGSAHHLSEAALLHDVGKSRSNLGVIQRSLVTVWTFSGLPLWGSWLDYVEHGRIGAVALSEAGANRTTVLFARHHPGPVPEGVPETDWHILANADDI
ncbi:MAG: hypothetical protein ACR2N7_00680 [Acidimicrobiia bacterium]